MAAFSRLQLAAALLEYDNDTGNPNTPRKSAYDSAIFSHLRRANGNIHTLKEPVQNPDYLGVKLASDSGSRSPSDVDKNLTRRSKASIDMLHNPFGGDEEEEELEEEPDEDDLEVDLSSWGLDSLIPTEKPSKKAKGKAKAKSDVLPNTVGVGPRPEGSRIPHSRTMSMPMAEFGEGGAFLDSHSGERRNTISGPLDLAEVGVLEKPGERQRFSSHPLIENLPIRPPLLSLSSFEKKAGTVPFPSSSPMPNQSESNGPSTSRPASRMNALEDESNPFAIPPPPASRASRFDPKTASHARSMSSATRLSTASGPLLAYDNEEPDENHLAPRAPSRASALDVKSTRDRRLSTASFGTRDMLDDDYQSAYGGEEFPSRDRRYSRLDLMRPKILVMPSPLQNAAAAPPPKRPRDGFLDSTDGRPLPPGARASRASMIMPSLAASVPVASNSFTPNPRLNLSASQLLFRNNLRVDGQRDVAYNDIDGNLQRAVEEGEQVKLEFPDEPEQSEVAPAPVPSPSEEAKRSRPPGKLYGRSLIDDLEIRKQEMKNKKRVFTGDQRPSMMDRAALKRSSTLIDPSSLPSRPTTTRLHSAQTDTALSRRNSRGGQPLLAIGDDGQIAETGDRRESKMPQTKSVFGVDTLWEREMARLKEIEAQEKIEREEARRKEEEEELNNPKKKKGKGKSKGKGKGKSKELEAEPDKSIGLSPSPSSPAHSSSVSPPMKSAPSPSLVLPDIPTVVSKKRTAPVPADDDSDYESSASEAAPKRSTAVLDGLVDQWVSDEENKPVAPTSKLGLGSLQTSLGFDEDSDEDVPLSHTLQRAAYKLGLPRIQPDDDSDEDRPLSMMLLDNSKKGSVTSPSISLGEFMNKSPAGDKSDDDDEPLGIRASRLPAGASQLSGISSLSVVGGNNDEDDRPLSMHPAQVRKSQFQMLAQAQQQQMFQAQMANSMVFPHPQSMMFMMPPAPFTPQQPPVQEPNKFNTVDRWRHDVAVVEGEP